jgi:hypothetical protein
MKNAEDVSPWADSFSKEQTSDLLRRGDLYNDIEEGLLKNWFSKCICNFNIFKDDRNLLKNYIALMTYHKERFVDGKKTEIYIGLIQFKDVFPFYKKIVVDPIFFN